MIFTETALAGAFLVDLEEKPDERGFFARTFDRTEFEAHGLDPDVVQCSVSGNHRTGTVRGMHYQCEPATETKLVRCTSGAVLDVIVDVRPGSPTYLQHVAVELTARNHRSVYVPALFAHGYQTLSDDAEVTYQIGARHVPGSERGLRHDDPVLGIAWPLPVSVISSKDTSWPLLERGVPGDGA